MCPHEPTIGSRSLGGDVVADGVCEVGAKAARVKLRNYPMFKREAIVMLLGWGAFIVLGLLMGALAPYLFRSN